nr:hypothetical protein [Tanacetum cinerariifolium]
DDEESENDEESDDEETREEESFDPIPRTLKDSEDDGNGEEDQGLRISKEERLNEEEEADDSTETSTLTREGDYHYLKILKTLILKSLEANFSEYIQTNPFAEAVSNILGIVHQYMNQQMNEAVRVAVQIQTDQLHDSYQRENDEFHQTIDENIKRIIKEQVKADLSEMELKKILIEKMEGNKVATLTPELLVGPTFDLMKGSCTSLIELEYHLEEVYKATTDQLDWVNPEGQQYPHNLLQPLPLLPDNRGRRVILFAHFINNDLEYLRGGASSHKYTTSVTKTKATDYGNIKRIITITDLKIVEWHSYKHLDWIAVRRNDDKLYKFKEGDFKRLRLQDIKDMLLLLVQGKLSNLTVEERFGFNVSLRMFTRSIVIQRRVEDL